MTRKTLIEQIMRHPDNTIRRGVINRWRLDGLQMYWEDLKNFSNDSLERKLAMQQSWRYNGSLVFEYGERIAS